MLKPKTADTSVPKSSMIYLDNNATTFLAPAVAERMQKLAKQNLANPSSQHSAGREARGIVERARENCLKYFDAYLKGMDADSLIFTSGGTESNNLAIAGLIGAKPGRLIVSSLEHPSVLGVAENLERRGIVVDRIRSTPDGLADMNHLEELLKDPNKPKATVVSVMAANNETGAIQAMTTPSILCHQHGALLHCDAVQVAGKLPISFQSLELDAMTITAHKIHGPIGVGALILRERAKIEPQLFGGYQQQSLRPGTESPLLAETLFRTLNLAKSDKDANKRMLALRDRLESELLKNLDDVVILSSNVFRMPHTSSMSFLGLDRQALQLALDLNGVACSTGSACASGSSKPSHVLQAMGVDERTLKGAIRFSLSRFTTEAEIEQAIEIITNVVKNLRKLGKNPFVN